MEATQIVIIGASGDLTARKLVPALAGLAADDKLPAGVTVVGVARRQKSDEQFRAELREAMPTPLLTAFDAMAGQIGYQCADVAAPEDLASLSRRLDTLARRQWQFHSVTLRKVLDGQVAQPLRSRHRTTQDAANLFLHRNPVLGRTHSQALVRIVIDSAHAQARHGEMLAHASIASNSRHYSSPRETQAPSRFSLLVENLPGTSQQGGTACGLSRRRSRPSASGRPGPRQSNRAARPGHARP